MNEDKTEWWRVTIVYKGGAVLSFDTDDFRVAPNSVGGRTFTWGRLRNDAGPILLGADDIAAVWQERV